MMKDSTVERSQFYHIDGSPHNNNTVCPQCGKQFECGSKAGKEGCWCFLLPPVAPSVENHGCFCPECLQRIAQTELIQREKGA